MTQDCIFSHTYSLCTATQFFFHLHTHVVRRLFMMKARKPLIISKKIKRNFTKETSFEYRTRLRRGVSVSRLSGSRHG